MNTNGNKIRKTQKGVDEEEKINNVLIFGKKDLKDYIYSWLKKSEVHNLIVLSSSINYIGKMDRVIKFMNNNGWEVISKKDKKININYIDKETKKEKMGIIEVTEITLEKIPAARRF